MTQWEYDIARMTIEDVYNIPDAGSVQAKEFMNNLGRDGWEIFDINSVLLGTTQHISYVCKRQM